MCSTTAMLCIYCRCMAADFLLFFALARCSYILVLSVFCLFFPVAVDLIRFVNNKEWSGPQLPVNPNTNTRH